MADSFISLSGASRQPLPDRYRRLKHHLMAGNEAKFVESWRRLLRAVSARNREVVHCGPSLIPSVDFSSLGESIRCHRSAIREQGCAVVRGVIPPPEEARAYKERIESYISDNPGKTNGFPRDNPQVWELYWSRPPGRSPRPPEHASSSTRADAGMGHSQRRRCYRRQSPHHVRRPAPRLLWGRTWTGAAWSGGTLRATEEAAREKECMPKSSVGNGKSGRRGMRKDVLMP